MTDIEIEYVGSADNQEIRQIGLYNPQECGQYLVNAFRKKFVQSLETLGVSEEEMKKLQDNLSSEEGVQQLSFSDNCFASMEDKKGGKGRIVSELKLAAAPTDTYEKVFKLLSAIKGVPDVEGKPVFLLVTILL